MNNTLTIIELEYAALFAHQAATEAEKRGDVSASRLTQLRERAARFKEAAHRYRNGRPIQGLGIPAAEWAWAMTLHAKCKTTIESERWHRCFGNAFLEVRKLEQKAEEDTRRTAASMNR